jgi:hypothetical protein
MIWLVQPVFDCLDPDPMDIGHAYRDGAFVAASRLVMAVGGSPE